MPYSILSHTADTGIEATASSLPGLLAELATGMFSLVAAVTSCDGSRLEVTVRAPSHEELVVDVLSELLYRAEVQDVVLCDFEVSEMGTGAIRLTATGVPLGDLESLGPQIKAVTYHDLVVSESDQGWVARVYFDV